MQLTQDLLHPVRPQKGCPKQEFSVTVLGMDLHLGRGRHTPLNFLDELANDHDGLRMLLTYPACVLKHPFVLVCILKIQVSMYISAVL